MDKCGHLVKAEHGSRALERMQPTKDRIDEIGVLRGCLQLQQLLLQCLENFARLLNEGIGRTGHSSPNQLGDDTADFLFIEGLDDPAGSAGFLALDHLFFLTFGR